MESTSPSLTRSSSLRRASAEFLVIVVGVLVALAADRWGQEQELADARAVYVQRLVEEIRRDSLEAGRILAALPTAYAARDSLLDAVLGQSPMPELSPNLLLNTWERFRWSEPVTWTELNNTGLLTLIDDLELRRAVSEYYAIRLRAKVSIDLAERRGRDPYMDTMYPLGIMDRSISSSPAAFRQWPNMDGLLRGLGGHFTTIQNFAPRMLAAAGQALAILEGRENEAS